MQNTSSHPRSAASGVLSQTAVGAIQAATNLLMAIWLARIVSPADYAVFGLAQVSLTFLGAVAGGAVIDHALLSKDKSEVSWTEHLGLVALTQGLGFAVVGSSLWALFSEGKLSIDSHLPVAVLPLALLLDIPKLMQMAALRLDEDWSALKRQQLAGHALGLAASAAFAISGMGLWALCAPIVLGPIPMAACLIGQRRIRLGARIQWRSAAQIIKYSGVRCLGAGANHGASLLMSAGLTAGLGLETFGQWRRAQGIITSLVSPVAGAMTTVMFPVVAKKRGSPIEFKMALHSLISAGSVVICIIAGLACVLAGIVPRVYGEQWSVASEIMKRLAPVMVMGQMIGLVCLAFNAANLPRESLRSNVAGFAVSTIVALAAKWMGWGILVYLLGIAVAARLGYAYERAARRGLLDPGPVVAATVRPAAAVGSAIALLMSVDLPPAGGAAHSWHEVVASGVVLPLGACAILLAVDRENMVGLFRSLRRKA